MANEQNLKPFKPGQSGNPAGSSRKARERNRALEMFSKLTTKKKAREFSPLSKYELDQWDSILLNSDVTQLQAIAKSEETPAYAKTYAMALLYDLKNGRTKTTEQLKTHLFGKDVQKMEITGKDGSPLTPERNLNAEEAAALFAAIDAKYKGNAGTNNG